MSDFITFMLGLGSVFLLGYCISIYEYMKKLKYIKRNIVEKYGKEIDIDEVNIKMESVSSYYRNKNKEGTIDDITWNDLSMDNIFKKINNTQSTAGRELLYSILRTPLYNDDDLRKRDTLIEYFSNNEKVRHEVQFILGKLGESKDLYTSNCLFNKDDNSRNKLLKYRILSSIPILAVFLMFFNIRFILLVVASICLNVYVSQNNKKYHYNIEGFSYMISVIKSAKNINDLNIEEININLYSIGSDLNVLKNMSKKYVGIDNNNSLSDIGIIKEYTNLIFLSELKNYEKVKETVIKNKKQLKSVYEYVGVIDALISIASYRSSLEYYIKPILNKSNSKDNNHINFYDIYHPLIKNPVPNSGEFKRSSLLTGSNASGKSTFIKTIAINAILAQSIYTCCAKYYSSVYFNIYTSMALKDDILSSESYYIVEIKSLKRILDSNKEDIPCLCFVDEILRGTNTVERIASSCEVLKSLSNENCICFAATHDIELTHILEAVFDNYHFEENITNKDISFDYKLHKGRSITRNAIKLLEFMGYNKNIVSRAEERADNFLESGSW